MILTTLEALPSLILIALGIIIGYKLPLFLYDAISLQLETSKLNRKKIRQQNEAFFYIENYVAERYQLSLAQAIEDYSIDTLSVYEKNEICSFYSRLNELGVKFIYIKSKSSNKLLSISCGFGKERTFTAHIEINEHTN